MITPDYVRLMAVYAHWQNSSLLDAAAPLGDEARRQDRGAFFGSIHATMNHLLWADQIWMHRLAGTPKPAVKSIPASTGQFDDWDKLHDARMAFDDVVISWSRRIVPDNLGGELTWYSGAAGADMTRSKATLVVHMFNHGTHHRGQIHAMLTAAGARPDDTDIPFMPARFRKMLEG